MVQTSLVERPPAPVEAPAPPRRRERERKRRRLPVWRILSAIVAVAIVVGLVSHPGRVAVQMLLLLPELFPNAPVRPLLWVSDAPVHEEYSYESAAGHVDADLYLPGSGGRHGAVILYTGAFGLRRDPGFVQFAEALAREGAVVMAPESVALRNGYVTADEADDVLQATDYLRSRGEVDPNRIGSFGFSAGGSIVLLAAEDPRGRDELAFLNIFGSYYDAPQFLREVVSREIDVDRQSTPWEPDEVTIYTVEKQIVTSLPDPVDREILGRVYLDKTTPAEGELDQLSADGRLAVELFERPSPARADAILDALPASSRERLDSVSPSRHIDQLKTRLYIMHDRSDSYVPFVQSRELAAAAPAGTVERFTEFDVFGHVTPNRQLDPLPFAGELIKLFAHGWSLGQEFL
jgi:prolyl oligopeptidase family protein